MRIGHRGTRGANVTPPPSTSTADNASTEEMGKDPMLIGTYAADCDGGLSSTQEIDKFEARLWGAKGPPTRAGQPPPIFLREEEDVRTKRLGNQATQQPPFIAPYRSLPPMRPSFSSSPHRAGITVSTSGAGSSEEEAEIRAQRAEDMLAVRQLGRGGSDNDSDSDS